MSTLKELPLLSDKKIVVFDFDGVLADSVEVKAEAFAEIYKPYGASVVDQVVAHHRSHGGVTRFAKFRHYHKEFVGIGITEEEIRQLSERFSSLVVERVILSPEIPGALAFVLHCVSLGLRCAINSATPEDELIEIVKGKGWERYFCCIHGASHSKSENLSEIVKRMDVSVSDAVFFGDAETDLEAAIDNRVDFVGIGEWMVHHYGDRGGFPVLRDFTGFGV